LQQSQQMASLLEPPKNPDDYTRCPQCEGSGFSYSDVVRGTCLSDAEPDVKFGHCDMCLGLGELEKE